MFHSLRHSWRPFTKGDEDLSRKMTDYYTNFAKFGDPNGKGGGIWKPYTIAKPEFILLDADTNKAVLTMSANPQWKGSLMRR
jgi:para-nitrobenzyl esterase